MNFDVYIITDWHRRNYTERLVSKMAEYTDLTKTELHIIENGCDWNHNLKKYLKTKTRVENFEVHSFENRNGLAAMWNWAMSCSCKNEWVVILNDDCVPVTFWEKELETLIKTYKHGMFLLCHPNGFSGFALSKTLWMESGEFNDKFPEGYYEDDDFFLKVAYTNNTDNKGVFKNHIFSYYDNYGKSLFKHLPSEDLNFRQNLRKWDKQKNKIVFEKDWKEVSPNTKGAIQNKGGKWYVYIGNKLKDFCV